jgi:hypothetical protein
VLLPFVLVGGGAVGVLVMVAPLSGAGRCHRHTTHTQEWAAKTAVRVEDGGAGPAGAGVKSLGVFLDLRALRLGEHHTEDASTVLEEPPIDVRGTLLQALQLRLRSVPQF